MSTCQENGHYCPNRDTSFPAEADLLRENAELRASNAELQNYKRSVLRILEIVGGDPTESVIGRAMSLTASNARLREKLEEYAEESNWDVERRDDGLDQKPFVFHVTEIDNQCSDGGFHIAKNALAETPTQSLAAITAPLEAKIAELQGKYDIERSGRETIISCYKDERDEIAASDASLRKALYTNIDMLHAIGLQTDIARSLFRQGRSDKRPSDMEVSFDAVFRAIERGSEVADKALHEPTAESLAAIQDAYWKRLHAAMMQLVTLRGINSRSAIADFVLDLEKLPDYLEDAAQMARGFNNGKTWQEEIQDAATRPYRELCAEVYQIVGALDGPANALDNLSDAANGRPLRHGCLLPYNPPDTDMFGRTAQESDNDSEWEDSDMGDR